MDTALLALAMVGLAAGLPPAEVGRTLGSPRRSNRERWALIWAPGLQCQHAQIHGYQIDAYFDGTFTVSQIGGAMLVLHEGKARKGRQGINHAKNAAEIWLSLNRDRLPVLAAEAEAQEVQR
jgi:hypothetical protein